MQLAKKYNKFFDLCLTSLDNKPEESKDDKQFIELVNSSEIIFLNHNIVIIIDKTASKIMP